MDEIFILVPKSKASVFAEEIKKYQKVRVIDKFLS